MNRRGRFLWIGTVGGVAGKRVHTATWVLDFRCGPGAGPIGVGEPQKEDNDQAIKIGV
eukprot:SAG11_NODE_176_length_13359_cov_10.862142_9_plen_58_part_00